MRYAKDVRTKQDVAADDVRGTARHRPYSCPVCGARVHYRSSMGPSPDPGFAHNKHTARPDCELYHPGFGYYVPSPSSAPRAALNAEDAPEEIGLCLEDGESWTTYLRLPEISDLGNVRLRSLRSGSVEVESGGTRNSLSLMELRPGIGSARLVVPPAATPYKIAPAGDWPASISQKRWQAGARGLNPRGTPFRMRRGEWVRLKEDSAVELGEELRVVADSRNAPPTACSPEAAEVATHNRISWRMWRVVLPTESTPLVERWAEDIGVVLLEAAWDISILSIPHAFNSEDVVPILGTRETLVGKLKSPDSGVQTMLSLRTGSASQTISVQASKSSTAFVAFAVPWPGSNELSVASGDQSAFKFDAATRPNLAELREALGAVPVLRISIGGNLLEPWKSLFELPAPTKGGEPPEIAILPDLEDVRLGLFWRGPEGGGSEEGLTVGAVKNRLRNHWGKDVEVRISGGALGSIAVRFCRARKAKLDRSDNRVLRWAALAGIEGGPSGGAWLLRRAGALDPKLLRAVQSRGNSKWMPLAISALKESE